MVCAIEPEGAIVKKFEPQVISEILQWLLTIGFTFVGTTLLLTRDVQLGLFYLILGIIMLRTLQLPLGFRIAALVSGSFLL